MSVFWTWFVTWQIHTMMLLESPPKAPMFAETHSTAPLTSSKDNEVSFRARDFGSIMHQWLQSRRSGDEQTKTHFQIY